MKRADLHRLISEKLEPKPEGPLSIHSTTIMSPLRFWCWCFEEGWLALDYSRSEDASAKLLDAMPNAQLINFIDRWQCECSKDWVIDVIRAWHRDRKTAVLLAAAKWMGIEDGELED